MQDSRRDINYLIMAGGTGQVGPAKEKSADLPIKE
jgi:hypothetical protein